MRGIALPSRRLAYFSLVGTGLLAGVWGAVATARFWSSGQASSLQQAAPAWVDLLVVSFLLCSAAGLGLIRPQLAPYRLGLVALGSASLAYWLVTPRGNAWRSLPATRAATDLVYQVLGIGFIVLIVGAWMLLARSVLGWTATLVSYLGIGLTLFVGYSTLVEPTGWDGIIFYTLLWPMVIPGLLGVGGFVLLSR